MKPVDYVDRVDNMDDNPASNSFGEKVIMERTLSEKKILLLAGTRVALGIGIGLLLSRRLSYRQTKVAGIALACAGGFSTIPLVLSIRRSSRGRDLSSVA